MVFRPPPLPTRNATKHIREANARALKSVPTLTSTTPPITLKWKDSVIDPAWLKANGVRPDGTSPGEKGTHWTDLIHNEVEAGLNKALDPEMFEKKYRNAQSRPEAMSSFDTFLDGLAQVIQDLFAKRAKLENATAPLDVASDGMDPDDLKELLKGDLKRVLEGLIKAVMWDALPDLEYSQVIKSVWENDICGEGAEGPPGCTSDVSLEEIAGFALDTISDDELMAEATRRGLFARLPSSAQAGTMIP